MNDKQLIKNSFKTLLEMLNDRKITLSGVDLNVIHNIIDNNSHKIGFEIILDNKIRVLYYLSNKFKFSDLKEFYKEKQNVQLEMLIILDKISDNNKKMLNNLCKNIQVFRIKELQFNISQHNLQPKFTVITDQSILNDLVKTYNIDSRFQLPLILKNDPIAKYYGLKSGDVLKITRISETSGTYTNYRCCY